MEQIERYRGCLVGLAIGDALGATVQFKRPGTFREVEGMEGGGCYNLDPGQWTDDTSMALCLAESLLEDGFDPGSQMDKYMRWWREGYLSSTGKCFDMGRTVNNSMWKYKRTGKAFAGPRDPQTAGNGSLMRLAPVPMYYAEDIVLATDMSGESSLTTHGAEECIDACRLFGGMLVTALNGGSKRDILGIRISDASSRIAEVMKGSYKRKSPPEIIGSGYVVKTLEAVLWAFSGTSNFSDGMLRVVNLGDDSDTTGAIYGQIAGAHYGMGSIPSEWVEPLCMRDEIVGLADRLYTDRF